MHWTPGGTCHTESKKHTPVTGVGHITSSVSNPVPLAIVSVVQHCPPEVPGGMCWWGGTGSKVPCILFHLGEVSTTYLVYDSSTVRVLESLSWRQLLRMRGWQEFTLHIEMARLKRQHYLEQYTKEQKKAEESIANDEIAVWPLHIWFCTASTPPIPHQTSGPFIFYVATESAVVWGLQCWNKTADQL